MYAELGIEPSAVAVAGHYKSKGSGGLLSGFVFDTLDEDQGDTIARLGVQSLVTATLMITPPDRLRLAREVLAFGERL